MLSSKQILNKLIWLDSNAANDFLGTGSCSKTASREEDEWNANMKVLIKHFTAIVEKNKAFDWGKVTENKQVVELLKKREEIEADIRAIEEHALTAYELQILTSPIKIIPNTWF